MENELAQFFNKEGKIISYPGKKKRSLRPYLYEFLASKFEFDKEYSEPEINQIIKEHIDMEDYVIWRRELIDFGYLTRSNDGRVYKLISKTRKEQ